MRSSAEVPQIQLFTARYGNPNIAGSGLVPVSIARYFPRFRLPYRIEGTLLEVAPTADMLARGKSGSLSLDGFLGEYGAQLVSVGLTTIVERLERLQAVARGVVLLCYEDVTAGERCHRTMLAEWLMREANLTIEELPDPGKKRSVKRAAAEPSGGFVQRPEGASDPETVDPKAVTTEHRPPANLPRIPAPLEADVLRLLVRLAVAIQRLPGHTAEGSR